jgi:hypothetical protein
VIEAALAHRLRDKAEAAYARGDLLRKRRQLMEAWARYLVEGIAKARCNNAVKVAGARARTEARADPQISQK